MVWVESGISGMIVIWAGVGTMDTAHGPICAKAAGTASIAVNIVTKPIVREHIIWPPHLPAIASRGTYGKTAVTMIHGGTEGGSTRALPGSGASGGSIGRSTHALSGRSSGGTWISRAAPFVAG